MEHNISYRIFKNGLGMRPKVDKKAWRNSHLEGKVFKKGNYIYIITSVLETQAFSDGTVRAYCTTICSDKDWGKANNLFITNTYYDPSEHELYNVKVTYEDHSEIMFGVYAYKTIR